MVEGFACLARKAGVPPGNDRVIIHSLWDVASRSVGEVLHSENNRTRRTMNDIAGTCNIRLQMWMDTAGYLPDISALTDVAGIHYKIELMMVLGSLFTCSLSSVIRWDPDRT